MYWTNFWQPLVQVQQNIFEKTVIEVYSSHLYASFGTFYVQIGQLFEAQWDFKLSEEIEDIFLRKQRIYEHFSKTHCVSNNWPICTQKSQKKRKDVSYEFL